MNYRSIISTLAFSISAPFLFGQMPGTLDVSFDGDGIVTAPSTADDDGEGIAVQSDGKIVIVGTSDNGSINSIRVQRYLTDGSLDNTFGTSGTVTIAGSDAFARSVVLQDDGKILVAGAVDNGNDYDFLVTRLNADGSLDNSFGVMGIAFFDFVNNDEGCEAIALQNDGKIVAAGSGVNGSHADLLIARYNIDGTVDNTFGTNGSVSVDLNSDNQAADFVVIQDDGKIVAGGTNTVSGLGDFLVVRVNADGTMDNSFGTNGVVTTDILLGNDEASAGAIQDDGKIIVHGTAEISVGPTASEEFCTIRYNADGTIDGTFGANAGIVVTPIGSEGMAVGTSVVIQTDGGIIVAGDAQETGVSHLAMMRYLADGTLDASFGVSGKVLTPVGTGEALCNAMALQLEPYQPILLVGESDDGSGNSDFTIARYNNTVSLIKLSLNEYSFEVYPNPINEESVIKYSLVQNEKISMKLYDLNGRVIQTILDRENQTEGDHQISLNIDNDLSSGNYLLKVESETWQYTIDILK